MTIKKGDDVFVWDRRYPLCAPRAIIVQDVSVGHVREATASADSPKLWYGSALIYPTKEHLLSAMRLEYGRYERTARHLEMAILTLENARI